MNKMVWGALCLAVLTMAEVPTFENEYALEHSGGEKWTPDGKYVSFTHADWDQDGDKDMLCGYMFTAAGTAGHIQYYENSGSDTTPVFEFREKFPITVGGA